MPLHITDKKISKSHTTVSNAAKVVVEFLTSLPEVKKVVLGILKSARGGEFRVKVTPEDNQLRVVVRGNTTIQTIYIISTNPQKVTKELEQKFSKSS